MNKKALLEVFLKTNSLNSIVGAIGSMLGCPILITDNGFHIVSEYRPDGYSNPEFNNAVSHSQLPVGICTAIADCSDFENNCFHSDFRPEKFKVSELKFKEAVLGFVIYILNENRNLNEPDRLFAEELISKQFFCEKHSGGTPTDTAEEILTSLLSGEYDNRYLFDLKVSGTFLSHFKPQRFAVVIPSNENHRDLSDMHLKSSLEQNFYASHPFLYEGKIILFLHKDHDIQLLKTLADGYKLKIAVSPELCGIYSLQNVYKTVCGTIDYVLSENDAENFIYCDRYTELMMIKSIDKRFKIPNKQILSLYNYDREKCGNLCLTLYTYIICKHSLSEAAEKLFTHRNTIQYRINKIREEFSIDTDDADKCLSYLLSLLSALTELGQEKVFVKNDMNIDKKPVM